MGIFKAYDIRGLVPQELDSTLARSIGRGFATFLKKGPIAIGRDMRLSSPELKESLKAGILESGLDVIDVGLCSTPMLNFSVAHLKIAGGVMVTASHNPGQYNGFKLCREEGIPLSDQTGIKDIERWVHESSGNFKPAACPGKSQDEDMREAYRTYLKGQVKMGSRALKVVADIANGMVGHFEFSVLKEIVPDTLGLYLEPDGSFPNHEANPLLERNLVDIKARVKQERADLGVAFDGDGDRVIFVDERGETAMSDLILALLAPAMLQKAPGSAVLYDLRSSRTVKEEIQKAGGKPVLSRVGHAFIKKTLRENSGIVGGELSGHFYFKDFYYLDSGILGALKLLELLSHQSSPLSRLIEPLDRYPRTGEINFKVDDADRVLAAVERDYAAAGQVSHLDGLSIETETYWFNLRKSNTEPLVRLNLQAMDTPTLQTKLEALEKILGTRADH